MSRKISAPRFGAAIGLVLAFCFPNVSAAVTIDFNLNAGTFVSLPPVGSQTGTYTGVYQSPTFNGFAPQVIGTGQTVFFDFAFAGSSQFITLGDSTPPTLPNEGVIFDVGGTGMAGLNPVIRILNVTGSYRDDATTDTNYVNEPSLLAYAGAGEAFAGSIRIGEFSAAFPNDPARFFNVPLDLTQQSLRFSGLQLELFNGGPDPITVTDVSFQAIANSVSIPTPAAFPLLGAGLALMGVVRSRRKRAAVT